MYACVWVCMSGRDRQREIKRETIHFDSFREALTFSTIYMLNVLPLPRKTVIENKNQ